MDVNDKLGGMCRRSLCMSLKVHKLRSNLGVVGLTCPFTRCYHFDMQSKKKKSLCWEEKNKRHKMQAQKPHVSGAALSCNMQIVLNKLLSCGGFLTLFPSTQTRWELSKQTGWADLRLRALSWLHHTAWALLYKIKVMPCSLQAF